MKLNVTRPIYNPLTESIRNSVVNAIADKVGEPMGSVIKIGEKFKPLTGPKYMTNNKRW